MRRIKRTPVLFFLLFSAIFYGIGTALLSVFPSLPSLMGEEVVFASADFSPPPSSLLTALPLSLRAPGDKRTVPLPSSQPKKVETPPQEEYPTYEAEPAMKNGVLQIKNSTAYPVDIAALLESPFPLTAMQPKVLILHTHTSEAYTPSEGYGYTPSDAYRTEDTDFNICRIGRVLAQTLEAGGITAIHDTTSHDYPSYSGCYGRSLETIEKNLALYPSIEIVIDLHRDAISAGDGSYLKTLAEINGKPSAQALVVVGTDAGGLTHPSWEKNLSLGLKLQKTLCEMYPGLARPLHLRTERFNGHAAEGALLIEIGSCGNTMEEALYCAELVGHALSKTISSLSA